jgi:hypothetical protein
MLAYVSAILKSCWVTRLSPQHGTWCALVSSIPRLNITISPSVPSRIVGEDGLELVDSKLRDWAAWDRPGSTDIEVPSLALTKRCIPWVEIRFSRPKTVLKYYWQYMVCGAFL